MKYPAYARQGNGRGVYVTDNFRAKGKYLSDMQYGLLHRLYVGLNGENREHL